LILRIAKTLGVGALLAETEAYLKYLSKDEAGSKPKAPRPGRPRKQ